MISTIGTIAALLSTIAFLPQTVYVLRTKDTTSLSLPMYILFFAGVLLWTIYGLLLRDLPLIFSNGIVTILAFIIMLFKIKNYQKDKETRAQRN